MSRDYCADCFCFFLFVSLFSSQECRSVYWMNSCVVLACIVVKIIIFTAVSSLHCSNSTPRPNPSSSLTSPSPRQRLTPSLPTSPSAWLLCPRTSSPCRRSSSTRRSSKWDWYKTCLSEFILSRVKINWIRTKVSLPSHFSLYRYLSLLSHTHTPHRHTFYLSPSLFWSDL